MEAASPPFHGGEVAVAYKTVALTATGGAQPYSWTLGAGALPNGLSLSSDGHVAGTPTHAGHFSFTVVVSDSGGGKANLNASATIVAALTANFLRACGSAGKCSVEQGCVTVCGGFGYQGGGSAPYSYNLTGGSVPPGTYQYGLSLAGKFTTTGTFNFKATLTDGYGATASLSPTFTVFAHIVFAGGQVGGSGVNSCSWNGCSQSLPYSGGSGTPAAQITGWSVPATYCSPGYPCTPAPRPTIAISGGQVVITVPGPGQTYGSGYRGTLSLLLSDRSLCGASTYCSSAGVVTVIVAGS
jgi:hypothetical protein